MNSLPILLKNPEILLIGAGKIAFQKAKVLLENQIDFQVIAKDISSNFDTLTTHVTQKDFDISDMESFNIVIDATGCDEVTNKLQEQKQKSFFLLNVVDKPEYCDFYFQALLQYGDLKISVSSSGASPTVAQKVRNKIQRVLPKSLENFVQEKSIERKNGVINPQRTVQQTDKLLGRVYLIGCGTGDVELLTLKAYRLIQQADVVLIDYLISDEIQKIIPKESEKVFVGKQKSAHSVKQDKINELLLSYAKKGLEVARLKSGDPYIFGRGAEEALYLINEGIRVEVIPGISSAIAAPLSAGIAPTARGYASSFSVISAHLRGNTINTDWCELLKLKEHTVVVLMGISRAKEIVDEALKIGVREDLKVAIISNATRENQEVIITTLKDLPSKSDNIAKPALLVFGEVVALHRELPTYQPILN